MNRLARCHLEVTSQNVVSRTIQTHISTLDYEHSSSPFTKSSRTCCHPRTHSPRRKRLRRSSHLRKPYSRSEHRSNWIWPTTNPSLHWSEPYLPRFSRSYSTIMETTKQWLLHSPASARSGTRQRAPLPGIGPSFALDLLATLIKVKHYTFISG